MDLFGKKNKNGIWEGTAEVNCDLPTLNVDFGDKSFYTVYEFKGYI